MPAMRGYLSLIDENSVCVRRLRPDQIRLAFPLVREAGRCDSLEVWKGYAAEFLAGAADRARPSGIIAAEQANRCIVGLFSFVVRPCLRFGRVLSVSELTVMAPFGRDAIAVRLLDAAAEIARQYRVHVTEIEPGNGAAWCGLTLHKHGYHLDDRRQIVWRRSADPQVTEISSVDRPGD